ncbi:MAG: oligosaccharide flippase family protein [Pirellulales bacterium]|nr:oligosaccharide flippase family protein [Pirellulales bacterium]
MKKAAANTQKRTLFTNAVWNWLGFIVSMAITFVMCPVLVHGLGDARYGVWSLIEALVAYIALLDLGIGASVVRYIAKFEEVKDQENLNRVFSTTLCIFLGTGTAAACVSAGMAALWHRPFGVSLELATEARWLILLLGVNVAIQLVVGVYSAVLYGLGQFATKVKIRISMGLVSAALIVAVLSLGGGLVALASLFTACTLVQGLITMIAVQRYLPDLRFSPSLVDRETFKIIRGYSALAFVTMMAGRIGYSSQTVIVGAFLAPQYVTFFVVAGRMTAIVRSGLLSIVSVLTPAISALEARGDQDAIRRAFIVGTRYMLWIVLPIEVGLLVYGKPFLSLWLGEQYAQQSYPTLVILSLPLCLSLPQSLGVRILYGIGRLKGLAVATVLWATFGIIFGVILVTHIGLEGVALGASVSTVIYSLLLAQILCRILDVNIFNYARLTMLKPLAAMPIAWAIWEFGMHLIPPTNWASLILTGATGTIAYAVIGGLAEFGLDAPSHFRYFFNASRK